MKRCQGLESHIPNRRTWSVSKSSRGQFLRVPGEADRAGEGPALPLLKKIQDPSPAPPISWPREAILKSRFFHTALVLLLFLAHAGCFGAGVKRDFVLGRDYNPAVYSTLAVINLDPQIQFGQYVEAELLRKGYKVKEGGVASQILKGKDCSKTLPWRARLKRIGDVLQVKGIVLCRVLEFSRFRDSYRLTMKCVAPETGDTLWYAEGAKEGKKGQKSGDLLKDIVASALQQLPRLP